VTTSLPGQVGERTLDSYADTVRPHLLPALSRKVLRRLTVREVDQLLTWKQDAGNSANSVRIIRAVLCRGLRQAEREGLVPRNVAALSAARRARGDEGRALTVDEMNLSWSDVDLVGRSIVISGSASVVEGRRIVGTTKGGRRRTVSIDALTVRELKAHRARQTQERLVTESDWPESDLVFRTDFGGPLLPDTVAAAPQAGRPAQREGSVQLVAAHPTSRSAPRQCHDAAVGR
jgi:integrase